jgi:uncharacterized membrane protein
MRTKLSTLSFCLLALIFAPAAAHAGGPLFVDPATLVPIRYAAGPVRIYTDLGSLGTLSNAATDARVAFAWKQWTDVPTSSFEAQVAGDFASIGLEDVTVENAGDVLGTFNGGGIHVIYDADGTLMRDYFGVPPSVLGIATPEFGVEGTPEITESWVVLNGASVDPADADGSIFTGVMTHEFGHAINLGHSQMNGAMLFFGDASGPSGCETPPYSGAPTRDDVETMYPFIDASPTGSALAASTVDVSDDVVSISNIYPMPGWPESAGTISGTITASDGVTQVAGVNVVARNVANPWRDAVSAITGDLARGEAASAGRYAFNGLTPGAEYAVYVDGIVAGGFSMAPAVFFPGPEEFFSGASESGNAVTDSACSVTTIAARAGATVTANIAFNVIPGAPEIKVLGLDTIPFDVSADGKTIVGYFSTTLAAPTFRFTDAGGLETIGGAGSTAAVSSDGSTIVSNTFQEDGFQVASIWQGGTSWLQLPGLAGSCDGAEPITKTVAFGVSNGGASVVGLGFEGGSCGLPRAFRWDKATNVTHALDVPADSTQSRANGISRDGRVVWGWNAGPTGFREAAIWIDGVHHQFSTDEFPVGEAFGASPNGKYVVGGYGGPEGKAWRWSERRGVEVIAGLPDFFYSLGFAVNASGNVVTGQSASFFDLAGWIWTPGLGTMRIEQFLASQGTYIDPTAVLYAPNSMSASGRRIVGVGQTANGTFGWYVDVKTVKVCHAAPGNPTRRRTIEVSFPKGLDEHLAHGDTLGACETDE